MKTSRAEYIKSLSLNSTIIWSSCELYNSNNCITILFVLKKNCSCKQQIYTTKNRVRLLPKQIVSEKAKKKIEKRKCGFQHRKRVILQSSLKDDVSLRYISQISNNTLTDLARRSNLKIQARS